MADLKPLSPSEEAVRRIAKDVGDHVVHHIETMYPAMTEAVAWTSARLSIRNTTFNAIMAAVKAADEGRDAQQIEANVRHRRTINRLRKARSIEDVVAATSDNKKS